MNSLSKMMIGNEIQKRLLHIHEILLPVLIASSGFAFLFGSLRLIVGMLACVSSLRLDRSGVDSQEEGFENSLLLILFNLLSFSKAKLLLEYQLLVFSLPLLHVLKLGVEEVVSDFFRVVVGSSRLLPPCSL